MRLVLRPLLAVLAVACLCPAAAAAQAPADPLFSAQWALQPAALDAPAAWQFADGSGVTVAIVDSGVDAAQPDLQGALWTNPGEIPGNGIDDDHDGFVDDVHGADFVDHDGDPADDFGHGTHIAGIIAAQRNSIGVAGLAPGAKVMAVKVLDAHGVGTTADVAAGIQYAVAHGASIINTSFNGDGDDPQLNAAIDAAGAAGVTVVASAGNDARDLDAESSWPASASQDNVLTVGATGPDGTLADYSGYGVKNVDIAAPGSGIASTAMGGGFEQRTGTSMAAPYVAAALALVQQAAPGAGAAGQRAALLDGATRTPSLSGKVATGELNVVAALTAAAPQTAARLAAVARGAVAPATAPPAVAPAMARPAATPRGRTPIRLTARVLRRSPTARRTQVAWTMRGAPTVATFRIVAGGRVLARRSAAARRAWVAPQRRRLRIDARDAAGHVVASASLRLVASR